LNVTLGVLAVGAVVEVFAFYPGEPTSIRILAGVGALAMVAAVWLVLRWGVHRDRIRLKLYAAFRGWTLHARDQGLEERFHVFPLNAGLGGRAVNVLRGPHRFHDCATFTFIVNKPVPQAYRVTMVELGVDTPMLQLLPEDVVAVVTKLTGGQDIKIGHRKFDSTWRIVAASETFAHQVLGHGLVNSFGRRSMLGMPIAIDGGAVLTWEAGIAGVRHLSSRLDILIEVVDAIPEEYWTGRRPGTW
jgi:hypothetical protein